MTGGALDLGAGWAETSLVQQLLLIALAGGLGALSRYGITLGLSRALGPAFPFGTLTANVLGCLLIGFLIGADISGDLVPRALRLPLTVGFLGALTTFSTFSYDTVRFLEHGAWGAALTNVGANLILGIPATLAGLAVAKSVVSAS